MGQWHFGHPNCARPGNDMVRLWGAIMTVGGKVGKAKATTHCDSGAAIALLGPGWDGMEGREEITRRFGNGSRGQLIVGGEVGRSGALLFINAGR